MNRWNTFLTKADKLDKNHVPQELAGEPAIVKAITAVGCMFDEEEWLTYEIRMRSLADVGSKIASAEEKGREEGANSASKAIALKMLGEGMGVETIGKVTGLTENLIRALLTDID